jgi:methionyl-tRNA synthetase
VFRLKTTEATMPHQKPILLTTPIYYVNGSPHAAHAYTTVACDVIARFLRLDGRRVHFTTGTDEHGQKVAQAARARGLDPQTFCDEVSAEFRAMNMLMNISDDEFIRTTEPRHARACQALWRALDASGQLYRGRFGGWYSVRDEAYFDENELIGGAAPTGAPVEWVEEDNIFFRLSQWRDRLLQFYADNPDFIAPKSRRNEVVRFVRSGLRDLSVSRTSFEWGIPVPGEPGHVMYVWLDALTNYLTVAGFGGSANAAPLWPADLHVVGKDILRFHCVYWPAFLMAAGLEPPRRVFAHGWWTVRGEKMSKSLNNFIPPSVLVDRYGVDGVRYFMIADLPFGSDGDLNEVGLDRRVTGELSNEFGNLAHRTLSMIAKYFGGIAPEPGSLDDGDLALVGAARSLLPAVRAEMAEQALQSSIALIWQVVARANRYVDVQKPWSLAKTDRNRLGAVLYCLAETLRRVAILMQPVIPAAAGQLLDQLGIAADERNFASLEDAPLKPGSRLPPPYVLFPKRDPNADACKSA